LANSTSNPNHDPLSEIPGINRRDTFRLNTNVKDAEKDQIPEVLFFSGAGASVPAGASDVTGLAKDFKEWLQKENKTEYLELTNAILDVINKDPRNNDNRNKADIETLLVITERLENKDRELLLEFFKESTTILSDNRGYYLISGGKKLLSEEIKRFIKTTFTDKYYGRII
jgi:hypothetical protein